MHVERLLLLALLRRVAALVLSSTEDDIGLRLRPKSTSPYGCPLYLPLASGSLLSGACVYFNSSSRPCYRLGSDAW